MDMKFRLHDLKMKVEAIILLLEARGDTNQEKFEHFLQKAQANEIKASADYRKEQWERIELGNIIVYPPNPIRGVCSVDLEVISISQEPFHYLAGVVVKKHNKGPYREGEVITIKEPMEVRFRDIYGHETIIHRG